VPASALAATNLKSKIVTESELGERLAGAEPVENPAERGGVEFNRGPRLDWIESMAGPLKRAKVEDLVPTLPAPASSPATARSRPRADAPARAARPSDPATVVQRAAEKAARDARAISERGGSGPPRVQVVRPFGAPGAPAEPKPPAPRRRPTKDTTAAPDTAR